jgi:lactoylglutathione lyase
VESLDTMLEYVREKGIPIHSGPFQPNPNIQFFFIQDPNGLKIQFVQNLVG